MKIRLLKTVIEAVEPGPRDVFLWDNEVTGFGVKVTPAGARVYLLDYTTLDGRRRRMNLGKHGVMDLKSARELAQSKLRQVAAGEDPLAQKEDARQAPTMAALCDEYLERHAEVHKKLRSQEDDRYYIISFIKPHLGTLKAASVTRREVSRMHHDLRETPTTANRVLACLSKMFNLAEVWGHRSDGSNPCRHVKRFKETKRRRFLSAEEMTRLGAVLARAEVEAVRESTRSCVAAVRLLLLTGCRMGEVLALKWSDCDLEGGRITLEDSKTGSRVVPLNKAAVEVLRGLAARRAARVAAGKPKSPWLLPGNKEGEPLAWLETFWQGIRVKAGIADVRLHDLRHTVGSVGAAEGLGLPIIGAILGHTQAATTQRYAHVATSPAAAAAEIIGQKIGAALAGDVAEVIDLNQEKRAEKKTPKKESKAGA